MGISREEYTPIRIQGMTEHELIRALCREQLTPDQVRTTLGVNPRSDSVIGEYNRYKARVENPDLYWDERIDNLKRSLETAKENKRNRVLPPMPYGF